MLPVLPRHDLDAIPYYNSDCYSNNHSRERLNAVAVRWSSPLAVHTEQASIDVHSPRSIVATCDPSFRHFNVRRFIHMIFDITDYNALTKEITQSFYCYNVCDIVFLWIIIIVFLLIIIAYYSIIDKYLWGFSITTFCVIFLQAKMQFILHFPWS